MSKVKIILKCYSQVLVVFYSFLRVYNDTRRSRARNWGIGGGTQVNIDRGSREGGVGRCVEIERSYTRGGVGVRIGFNIGDTSRAHIRGRLYVSNERHIVVGKSGCSTGTCHCVCNSLSGTNLPQVSVTVVVINIIISGKIWCTLTNHELTGLLQPTRRVTGCLCRDGVASRGNANRGLIKGTMDKKEK